MATSLPTEITDEIIDCVHDDRGTLISCSLTCCSWRARSQHHLFALVTLAELEPIERLSAILIDAPHLAMHIRHIQLPVDLEYCDSFLSTCPLPSVEELTLMEPGSYLRRGLVLPPGTTCAARLGTAFPNTRSMTSMHIEFGGFSVLLDLMHAFPRLVHVRLHDTDTNANTSFHSHGAHVPSLQSLALERCWDKFLEPWLHPFVYPLLQGLHRLVVRFTDLYHPDMGQATSMGVLAGRLARTLETLEMIGSLAESKDMIVAYCANVLPNPTLRHARISIGAHSTDTGSDTTPSMLIAHMRTLGLDSRAHVEVVVLHDEPHISEWQAIQGTLSDTPLPYQFTLVASDPSYDPEED